MLGRKSLGKLARQSRALQVKNKFISWDFFSALFVSTVLYFVVPEKLAADFTLSLYGIGISVITMCIFYFLAVLALLVAASDEKFVRHLARAGGAYVSIFNTYKYTIVVLFIALMYSLLSYGVTAYYRYVLDDADYYSRFFFLSFLFLFNYSILTALESTLDSVDYLKLRTMFMFGSSDQEGAGKSDGNNV